MTYALQPNGRFLDFRHYHVGQSAEPGGVQKQSYVSALYGAGAGTGFYAPAGAVQRRPARSGSADRRRRARDAAGAARRPRADRLPQHRGPDGVPAPLLVENGWTDDLFPAEEALRVWRIFRGVKGARVTLQLGDLGHPRGANKADRRPRLQHPGRCSSSPPTSRAPAAGRARLGDRLHADLPEATHERRAVPREELGEAAPALRGPRRRGGAQTITSSGGDPDDLGGDQPDRRQEPLRAAAAARAAGTAVAERRVGKPFTMIGMPTVRAEIRTKGRGGMIASRLWDVTRPAGAGLARHLPARGQPEGQGRVPAVRERLALRARPHRQAWSWSAATRPTCARATSTSR